MTASSTNTVHYVTYSQYGYQSLCSAWRPPGWGSMQRARMQAESDPIMGRTAVITLTRDPVDCMTCLVRHGKR